METLKLKGTYKLECRKADGSLKWSETVNNIVTNAGLAELAGLAGNTGTPTAFTYLAVGTSNTAVAATDTTLTAEITTGGLERASATVSRTTTTVTNDTLQLTKTWTSTASHTVEEVGVFNAASSGDMLSHALTGTKSVANTETLTATYTLAFA